MPLQDGYWNSDTGVFGGTVGNYAVKSKQIFLGCLQGYFLNHPKYTWTGNVQTSDILILDKFSFDLSTAGKKPAIIISRGPMRWLNTTIGKLSEYDMKTGQKTFRDILQSSLTFTCISKSGMQAEELATIVFNVFSGYKDLLRKAGVHQILDINLDRERSLRIDSEKDVSVVEVTVYFNTQESYTASPAFYNIQITKTATYVAPIPDSTTDDYFHTINPAKSQTKHGEITQTLLETKDFGIGTEGYDSNYVVFTTAPETYQSIVSGIQVDGEGLDDGTTPYPSEGSLITGLPTFTCTYLSATTLTTIEDIITGDGTTRAFELSDYVYGFGPILEEVTINYSGEETDPDTWEQGEEKIEPWVRVSGYDA